MQPTTQPNIYKRPNFSLLDLATANFMNGLWALTNTLLLHPSLLPLHTQFNSQCPWPVLTKLTKDNKIDKFAGSCYPGLQNLRDPNKEMLYIHFLCVHFRPGRHVMSFWVYNHSHNVMSCSNDDNENVNLLTTHFYIYSNP
jgi:hypothetical protein